jgi:hypothetical protein
MRFGPGFIYPQGAHTLVPQWILVATAGHLATSLDTVTWTSRVSGFGASGIRDVGGSISKGYLASGDSGLLFGWNYLASWWR